MGAIRRLGLLAGDMSQMWIETTNTNDDGQPVTTRLTIPELDEYVEFSETGKAQVSKDVGEILVREIDSIVASGSADSDSDDDDSDADAEDAEDDADD